MAREIRARFLPAHLFSKSATASSARATPAESVQETAKARAESASPVTLGCSCSHSSRRSKRRGLRFAATFRRPAWAESQVLCSPVVGAGVVGPILSPSLQTTSNRLNTRTRGFHDDLAEKTFPEKSAGENRWEARDTKATDELRSRGPQHKHGRRDEPIHHQRDPSPQHARTPSRAEPSQRHKGPRRVVVRR